MQALPFAILQMQAVGKYAAFAGELMLVIHIKIAIMGGKQRFYPGDLLLIFAEMGMQPGIGKLVFQLLHFFQQLRR